MKQTNKQKRDVRIVLENYCNFDISRDRAGKHMTVLRGTEDTCAEVMVIIRIVASLALSLPIFPSRIVDGLVSPYDFQTTHVISYCRCLRLYKRHL